MFLDMQDHETTLSHLSPSQQIMQTSSSRILYDIPCKVCRDHSSGKHYGIFACDGCAGFFKRSIRKNRNYTCKAKKEGRCMVDKTHRNQCRSCRLARCLQVGMNKDAVQHERGPRNSTLRRQMVPFFKEPEIMSIPHPLYCSMSSRSTVNSLLLEAMCEQAARILSMNVQWVKDLLSGTGLVVKDQLDILEASWRELFLLAAARIVPTLDPSALLTPGPQSLPLAIEVSKFRETLVCFHSMNLDAHEFACVKAITLFTAGLDSEIIPSSRSSSGSTSSGSGSRLRDPATVARLRDGAQLALGQRLSGTSVSALRFGKILMILPTLRSVSARAIEELFFKSTIGIIPIEKVICDMYKVPGEKIL